MSRNGAPFPFIIRHWCLIRHSEFVLRISACAALLLVSAPGCGQPKPQKPKAADPFVIRGRVVDAESGQPIPQARVRFLANLQTILGPRSVSALDTTSVNGTYQITLGGACPSSGPRRSFASMRAPKDTVSAASRSRCPKRSRTFCAHPTSGSPRTPRSRPVPAPSARRPPSGSPRRGRAIRCRGRSEAVQSLKSKVQGQKPKRRASGGR